MERLRRASLRSCYIIEERRSKPGRNRLCQQAQTACTTTVICFRGAYCRLRLPFVSNEPLLKTSPRSSLYIRRQVYCDKQTQECDEGSVDSYYDHVIYPILLNNRQMNIVALLFRLILFHSADFRRLPPSLMQIKLNLTTLATSITWK